MKKSKPTHRELQIISLGARGASKEFISQKLHIEDTCLQSALYRVAEKLQCDNGSVMRRLTKDGALDERGFINFGYLYPKGD